MSFIDRIAGVYEAAQLAGLEDFLVNDCVRRVDLKVVLLCESPHTDEVASDPRRPLLGKSGNSVTKVLRRLVLGRGTTEGEAIGDLVCGDGAEFGWLGLMNACPIPMQSKAYPAGFARSHRRLLGDLETIRKGRKKLSPVQLRLAEAIASDLADRWNAVRSRVDVDPPLVIACGEAARSVQRQSR